EQFVHTGYGQRSAGSLGAAEEEGVVAQRILEVLPQPDDEPVNEGGEVVGGGFGEGGRGATVLEVDGEVVVRGGAFLGIRQQFAEGEGTALLDDSLGHVALFVEQDGEGTERRGPLGGGVLADLEARLPLRLRLTEAAQPAEHIGAIHPSAGDVLRR